MPNPVHTAYIEDRILPWNEKDNSILISGSYRTCRMELFKQLFREQPFKWPVFFFPPNNEKEIKNIQVIDEISSFHPEYVLRGSGERDKYNKEILKHLNKTKIFVDCTFNPYPNLHISHANGTLEEIEKVLPTYLGGYAPERVLDACYMGNTVVALHNKALNFVLRDNLIFYSNYKELVEKIREAIEHEEINLKPFATESQKLVKDYTTEEVIKHLAEMFKTGKYSNPYQDRRHT